MRFSMPSSSLSCGLIIVLVAAIPVHGQRPQSTVVKNSDIVFIGTVLKTGAVSFHDVPVTGNTVIVTIDSVLEKPRAVSLDKGDRVTVVTKDPSQFRAGVHATFYTVGWIFGDGVAVREIGHDVPADPADPPSASQKQEEQMQARKQISDADLRDRIRQADLVIAGQVRKVEAASTAGSPTLGSTAPITEHDPEWKQAVIHVESSIKGAPPNQNVVVRFPGSIDVAWYDAPKLKEGQQGVFFLQTDKISGAPKAMLAGHQVPAYTVLSPSDVLSKDEMQRVRALANK